MIYDNLNKMIADATKSGNKETLEILRAIKSDLTNALKDGIKLDEANEVKILTKMINQREESIRSYKEAGRMDLVDEEQKQIDLIRQYIPKQPSEEEVGAYAQIVIRDYKEAKGEGYALSMKDMAPILNSVKEKYNTPCAGKVVSTILKSML